MIRLRLSMSIFLKSIAAALVWGAVLVLFTGCAWLAKPPVEQEQARILVERYAGQNPKIQQFKGIGQLRLRIDGRLSSGRVAYAAAMPDKLRVEWLNMMGQPLTSLAGDGKTITILSYDDPKLRRVKQTDTALAPMIRVPVGIETLTAVLAGRLPMVAHVAAQMALDNDVLQIIDLKNRWANTVATFQVDKQERQLQQMTVYNGDGSVRYTIDWTQWQVVLNRKVPRRIEVAAGTGERISLVLDRYWFDVELSPATFVLSAPGEME